MRPALFERLADANSVLIAGAGGGFDIYAGLPLALSLMAEGKSVHLANFSFAELYDPQFWLAPGLAAVVPTSQGNHKYFPERTLARWLVATNRPAPVYAFVPEGVVPLRKSYEHLANLLQLDAVVLIDGGTDILLRGDEERLGTPVEDMTSLAALDGLSQIPTRLVAAIGFGIDSFHGVSHTLVLENMADLTTSGAYLGAFSPAMHGTEVAGYLDAVAHAKLHNTSRPSIVNGQIAASMRGEFGNSQFTSRTSGSELLVNPMMNIYFTFDLDGLARNVGYLDSIKDTNSQREVEMAIGRFRAGRTLRSSRPFPH